MKIGQAIDNIYQNKELEYESEKLYIGFNKTLREVIIKPKNSSYNTVVLLGCYGKERFELVQKPVTFMEAFEHFRKGGKVEVICEGMNDKIFEGGSEIHFLFHEEYIENGKWYIKEDN